MTVHLPASLQDALRFKAAHPDARPLLGGTDLLAQWQAGAARPAVVLALEPLNELKFITAGDHAVTIGAGVSHHALAHHPEIIRRWPALAQAARTVGAPAIQMMGTIGGNLANASPAADLPPALLAYDAVVTVASAHRERQVAIAWFFTAYRRVDLGPDELIVSIRVAAPPPGATSAYYKVGTRAAQSIARVGLAACLAVENGLVSHARFAAASMAAVPLRLAAVEDVVTGRALTPDLRTEARRVAATTVSPIDDVRATAEYRRVALGALVERFLRRAGT